MQTDPRRDLAACIRMLEANKILDYNGHCSVRHSDSAFYVNIGKATRATARPEDICLVTFEGEVLSGNGTPPLEFHLHAGIYKARKDVNAVIHAHSKWSTYLTMARQDYFPVFVQGSLLYPMPILDTPNSINTKGMGDQLAQVLRERPACLLKSHGAVVVGSTLTEAFALVNYLEENAERQYHAQMIGTPYQFSAEERALSQQKLWSPGLFQRTWDHFAAKLQSIN